MQIEPYYLGRKPDNIVGIDISPEEGDSAEINFLAGLKAHHEAKTIKIEVVEDKLVIVAPNIRRSFHISENKAELISGLLKDNILATPQKFWGGTGLLTLRIHFPALIKAARSRNSPGAIYTRRN